MRVERREESIEQNGCCCFFVVHVPIVVAVAERGEREWGDLALCECLLTQTAVPRATGISIATSVRGRLRSCAACRGARQNWLHLTQGLLLGIARGLELGWLGLQRGRARALVHKGAMPEGWWGY